MGIVAPMSGVTTAGIPVIVGLFTEGLPPTSKLLGLIFGCLAVWLLSGKRSERSIKTNEIRLVTVAGTAFGVFLILIDQVSKMSVFWPLVSARAGSIGTIIIITCAYGRTKIPEEGQLPLIGLAGILDSIGNACFALATRIGRLDISAVLGSLYPGVTVLLACLILK